MQPDDDLEKRYNRLRRRNYDTEVMSHIALNHQMATRDQNQRLLNQLMAKDRQIQHLQDQNDDLRWKIHELKKTIKKLKDKYFDATGELLAD